jgi:hypothetical protein
MHYRGSLLDALRSIYPHHRWLPWLFNRTPRSFWKDMSNRKEFFDWVASSRGITGMEEWYNVPSQDVAAAGGVSLLNAYYEGKLSHALISVYPTHKWKPWRFVQVPKNCWSDLVNQREFMDSLAKDLQLSSLLDWYYQPAKLTEAEEPGLWSLLISQYDGSLSLALSTIYPDHNWDQHKFVRTSSTVT